MRIINTQPADPLAGMSYNGIVFVGFVAVAAVAAQSSMVALTQNAGSGVADQIIDIMVSLASAGDIVICNYATQLATRAAGPFPTTLVANTSNAQLRSTTAAAIPGTQLERLSLPAAQSVNVTHPYLYSLPPGSGLLVASVAQNVAMTVTFRFVELTG